MSRWGVVAMLAAGLASTAATAAPQPGAANLFGSVSASLEQESRAVSGVGSTLGRTATATAAALAGAPPAPSGPGPAAHSRPGGGTVQPAVSRLDRAIGKRSNAISGAIRDQAGTLSGRVDRAARGLAGGVRGSADTTGALVNEALKPGGAATESAAGGALPGLPGSAAGAPDAAPARAGAVPARPLAGIAKQLPGSLANTASRVVASLAGLPGPSGEPAAGAALPPVSSGHPVRAITNPASLPLATPLIRLLERLLDPVPAGSAATTGPAPPPAVTPPPSPQAPPGPAGGRSPASSAAPPPSLPPAGATHPLAGMAHSHPFSGQTALARANAPGAGPGTGKAPRPARTGGATPGNGAARRPAAGQQGPAGHSPATEASPTGAAGSATRQPAETAGLGALAAETPAPGFVTKTSRAPAPRNAAPGNSGGPGPEALLALLGGLMLAWPRRRHRRGLPPLPSPSLELHEPHLLRGRGTREHHEPAAPGIDVRRLRISLPPGGRGSPDGTPSGLSGERDRSG